MTCRSAACSLFIIIIIVIFLILSFDFDFYLLLSGGNVFPTGIRAHRRPLHVAMIGMNKMICIHLLKAFDHMRHARLYIYYLLLLHCSMFMFDIGYNETLPYKNLCQCIFNYKIVKQ